MSCGAAAEPVLVCALATGTNAAAEMKTIASEIRLSETLSTKLHINTGQIASVSTFGPRLQAA
jgi:hypothetical protein